MTAITFRTAPIAAYQLRDGDQIDLAGVVGAAIITRRDDMFEVVIYGGPRMLLPAHSPVLVTAPSGPHPVDGWTTWWRTPNEYSPCTCLHRPTGVPGNWAPSGLDAGCREHAGADQWED